MTTQWDSHNTLLKAEHNMLMHHEQCILACGKLCKVHVSQVLATQVYNTNPSFFHYSSVSERKCSMLIFSSGS